MRTKRGAAAKDVIPDESFLRLRGALFFGPGFLVTRNKLTFRDNLQELLRTAVPSEKHLAYRIAYLILNTCQSVQTTLNEDTMMKVLFQQDTRLTSIILWETYVSDMFPA